MFMCVVKHKPIVFTDMFQREILDTIDKIMCVSKMKDEIKWNKHIVVPI